MEQNEPYEIIAENMFIEREQNVGFSGNVVLKQGLANLKADQILLFSMKILIRKISIKWKPQVIY